jgi:hypothetical protein
MAYRLSKSLAARKFAGATILGALVLVGPSLPTTLAQGADVGTRSGAAMSEQSVPNAPEPPRTPAPENRANQPPFDPIAARIKYLHDRLRITPAQEPLWAKVAQVMRENAQAVVPIIKERVQSTQHGKGDAIEYLDLYEKLGEVQLEGLKKFVAAFQALYNTLSPAQKKIADSMFRLGPMNIVGGIPQPPGTAADISAF